MLSLAIKENKVCAIFHKVIIIIYLLNLNLTNIILINITVDLDSGKNLSNFSYTIVCYANYVKYQMLK